MNSRRPPIPLAPARADQGLRRWLWQWLPPLCLAAMLLSGCKVGLYSDLDESQANEMLAAMSG